MGEGKDYLPYFKEYIIIIFLNKKDKKGDKKGDGSVF